MQPQSVHYQCITCYMQSYLVAGPPTFLLSNLRDKVHPGWVTTGDKMLRGDAAVIWALQMHVIPFFLCLLRCIPCDNVRCDPMWRWYEMQWDAQQSYLSTLDACRSTFPVSTLGPEAAGQSASLSFFSCPARLTRVHLFLALFPRPLHYICIHCTCFLYICLHCHPHTKHLPI